MSEQFLVKIEMAEGEGTMQFTVDSREKVDMFIKDFEREKKDFKFRKFVIFDKATGEPVYYFQAEEQATD